MNIPILYEDKDILAIDKPSGLVVHGDGRTKEESVASLLLKKYPNIAHVGEPWISQKGESILRGGIVHRLDRETSGVMLVAKTSEGFECLKKQFQNREVKKEYRAFVFGEIKNDKAIIDRPIGKSRSDFRKWSAQRGAKGEMRDAVTEYNVLLRGGGYSFVSVFPKTGRTHQIRVHFKAINYPLVSDILYGSKKENSLGFKRLALHSFSITFKNLDGQEVVVNSQYPEDFKSALDMLQK